MKQGFLNRSARVKNQKGDGMKTSGSILSELAKRVKNINGKVLGKDGKPLKAYHFVTFGENNEDTSVTTTGVDSGIHARNINDVVEVGNPSNAVASHVNSPTAAHVNRQNTFSWFCELFLVRGFLFINMEQGFLNRSARVKNQKGDGIKTSGSILSGLAKRVKNIDGKVLGKDVKPLKAYHSLTFGENNKDTSVTTARVDSGINARNIDDVVEVRADVTIHMAAVKEVSNQFANTLYGNFIGNRLAFPIVETYFKNAWAKFGFKRIIMRNGFLFLVKEIATIVTCVLGSYSNFRPRRVKFHNSSKLGKPIMMDAYTSDLCLNPCGRNSYAQVLIEISSNWKAAEARHIEGVRLSKSKTKFLFRLANKDGNNEAGKKEGKLSNRDSRDGKDTSSSTSMEPQNYDVGSVRREEAAAKTQESVLRKQISSKDKGVAKVQEENSLYARFMATKKASTSKPNSSMRDLEDESDENEVYMPDDDMSKYISSNSGGSNWDENDLECYDGYENQVYDLLEEMQVFCERYDMRIHDHGRK
uniref:Zinc knuckle CX2CX4HX4C n=1 Tax=Tanacetum cinerariifolium TaxID=118510 RepID=A0A699H5I3_TANCI|nr:hypothetical protein [Tanacetum cinerariifolium]